MNTQDKQQLIDTIEWSMTPYSRRQWGEIRKRGFIGYLFTSGITWWFAFLLSIGPVVSLMIVQESRRDLSHGIWLALGIVCGFLVSAVNWRHCEKMWASGAGRGTD